MNIDKLRLLFERSKDKYADAKLIGTTYQTMHNIIFKGSICKVDLLEKIARFYKVPVGYFFDEVNSDTTTEIERCKQENQKLKNILANENIGQPHIFLSIPINGDELLDLREIKSKVIKALNK